MAWNGSDNVKGEKVKGEGVKGTTFNFKALFAGLVVVLGGGLIAWFFLRPAAEHQSPAASRQPSAIAEVRPQIVTNDAPAPEAVAAPKPVDPNARPTKVGEELNGYVMLPSGRIHRRVGVVTNSIAARAKGKYAIFERSCNNEIACYLTLKPGDIVFGSRKSDGSFKRDFLESLKEPLFVSHDDTPEVAQLKRDVIAARVELKAAMDRGEDIDKIMSDTRQELQDMMRLKLEYKKMFNEQRKACETEEDVEDFFNACNKMLEQKGCSPLTYGPITRRNMLRERENEKFKDTSNTED